MRKVVAVLALVFLLLPASAFAQSKNKKKDTNADPAQIGTRDITKGKWNFYSPEREIELGRELAQEAERTSHVLRDPLVVNYVTEVAERIARNSDLRVPIRVRVIDSSEVNAFALPGGFFFVTTGLLLATDTEAELAGVIAHEIAHVAARHATRQMTRAQLWNLMSIPLALWGGPVAYAIQQGAALAVPLTFLKFSRNAEKEADLLGLQYHYASGYDPVAFVTFFERMKAMDKDNEPGGIAKVFATHPMAKDRIVAAERFIEQNLPGREEYVVNTSQHDEVRGYLMRMFDDRARMEPDTKPVLRKRPDWTRPSGNEKKQ